MTHVDTGMWTMPPPPVVDEASLQTIGHKRGHSACSAAKSLGQSALRRTKESAGLVLSPLNHP